MLISPYFLFRSELGQDGGQGNFVLTPYETASALSYTYWGTMPDDALLQARQERRSGEGNGARSASATPAGRPTRAKPHRELLLRVARVAPGVYRGQRHGHLPQPVQRSVRVHRHRGWMRAEEDAFVTHVVFDSTKKFSELFTADYTFANDSLASYYGLSVPEGHGCSSPLVRRPRVEACSRCSYRACAHERIIAHATRAHDPRQHSVHGHPAPAAERKHGHYAGHTGQDGTRALVLTSTGVRHVPQPAGSDS